MANLVISGDTSGSVTLAAPAVSGTTVLTLPTTTGTLVVTGGAQTIEFADGTVSAPSITNSGDTNTGIFFPAADTIAFTEGGVESMRIDSSGNVGIGTSSPSDRLVVSTGSYTIGKIESTLASSSRAYWQFNARDTSAASMEAYVGWFGDALNTFDIRTGTSHPIRFATNNTERMRIDSSGNVGIGLSNGAAKLTVAGTNANGTGAAATFIGSIQINEAGSFSLQTTGGLEFKASVFGAGYGAKIFGADDGALLFGNRANSATWSERMRIDQSGNVGIGTSSPTTKLQVTGTLHLTGAGTFPATGEGLEIVPAVAGGNNFIQAYSRTASAFQILKIGSSVTMFETGGSERMRILDTGEVCIGRTSGLGAGTLLAITSASGNASINCGDAADGTAYGMVQINRVSDQPDNKFHLSFVRTGQKIAGMGFLDNSSTFAIQNATNNTGAGVGLTDGATSWSTVSDERKKDIIAPVENALIKLANWRTVYYKYKIDEADAPQRVGLIAQDVLATLPEAVTAEDDELKTLQVRYTETVPLLVKAIQELNAKVTALEKQLGAK